MQAGQPAQHPEVVIAAFTDDDRDEDLAEILTQEQADAVRRLPRGQALDPVGRLVQESQGRRRRLWLPFPRTLDPHRSTTPSRRVEIILFTPQT